LTIHTIKYGMNDYRVIKNHYLNKDIYYKLTPEYTISVHKQSVEFIQKVLTEKKDSPVVVITHHGPTFMSINEKYRKDVYMNGGYASDLSNLILDNENIRVWVHGHMHDPVDYQVGNTRVVSNPKGYVGYDDTSNFNPDFYFEV